MAWSVPNLATKRSQFNSWREPMSLMPGACLYAFSGSLGSLPHLNRA
jgi:hypothetical protein